MRGQLMSIFAAGVLALTPLAAAGVAEAAPQGPAAKAPYAGPKRTVSVDLVGAPEAMGGSITNEALVAMFTEALAMDGRFIVVERTDIAGVQAEQQLGATAAANKETGAQTGALIGASILIRATVTKFEPNAGGGGIQIAGLPALGNFAPGGGLKGQYALVEITLRMIDTSTGQVIGTAKAQGRASTTQATMGITDTRTGANLATNAFKTTPLGKAADQAIMAAVEKIDQGVQAVPWSALIVDASNGQVYVNIGADQNIGPGAILHVYRKGKMLTDPGTGAVLDVLMDEVGAIQILQVRDKVSTATVVSGSGLARGDIVKLQ